MLKSPNLSASAFERTENLSRCQRRATRALVIAPHPDDEVLAVGGTIQEHLRKGHVVKVVLITCGDGQRRGPFLSSRHFRRLGERRYHESLEALSLLGLRPQRVIALGYPDRGLAHLSADGEVPYTSKYTKALAVPYSWAWHPHAPHTQESILQDLHDIFSRERPDIIYIPHPSDRHSDHRAAYTFSKRALEQAQLSVIQRHYLIHHGAWPLPAGKHPNRCLVPPRALRAVAWSTHNLRTDQIERKCQAISKYLTQTKYFEDHLFSFARKNELFALSSEAASSARPSRSKNRWMVLRVARLPKFLTRLHPAQSSDQSHE